MAPSTLLYIGAALFLVGIGFFLAHHIIGTLLLVAFAAITFYLGAVSWSLDSSGDATFH